MAKRESERQFGPVGPGDALGDEPEEERRDDDHQQEDQRDQDKHDGIVANVGERVTARASWLVWWSHSRIHRQPKWQGMCQSGTDRVEGIMTRHQFSIGEAISYGWNTTIRNLGFWIVLLIVAAVIQAIPSILGAGVGRAGSGVALLIQIIAIVLSTLVTMGLLKAAVMFVDGRRPTADNLIGTARFFLNYLAASILYSLIVTIGLILLIIPGIYFAIRYQFFGFLIVDRGVGPLESLSQSATLTQGVKWKLLGLDVLTIVIFWIGALAFLVGLFFAIPTILLAQACVYRTLLSQTESIALGRAA